MRGEHFEPWSAEEAWKGSSPRARGAPGVALVVAAAAGIIPACAGSTLSEPATALIWKDHPRVRGEHWSNRPFATTPLGSSPRARGAPFGQLVDQIVGGIIPACAGSTVRAPPRGAAVRDHPRVRGEHLPPVGSLTEISGSSPRARGAPWMYPRWVAGEGIIPACAGSTTTGWRCSLTPGDHPRVRGEHRRTRRTSQTAGGSSPRARGALPRDWLHRRLQGIIPACAGSTAHPRRACGGRGDHPRVRGEHTRPAGQRT